MPYENALFRAVPETQSGISFENNLEHTEQINTYTFKNFYNGGGVGIGDLNNDGLPEVFLSGNMVSSRLYLNKGKLQFEDITEQAGLFNENTWTTGVSFVDINADGFLDIYVCKSGPPGGERRNNELFVNNRDMTFTEKSKEYGLAFEGLSTHAAFFDFDKDGDLDCYLLNNSFRPVGGNDLRRDWRKIPDPAGGNRLLRNDDGKFSDISAQAGIFTSEIGFGLGVSIADLDNDSWPDIFVSNDFFERDYLYHNNGDGTFRESLEDCMREISLGSMGADIADINNDALPEVFVTEMLPERDDRLKTTTQFENWNRYMLSVDNGYYHQFSRNVLQLNNGNGHFSEIGRLAGVNATDWSWGALIFDMDNDGLKDIFVANGIYKDLLDQDYVNFAANPETVRELMKREKNVISHLIDSIPTNRLPNYAFANQGDLTFRNTSSEWGFGLPTNSNGSAYGDLDNDGDEDLVLNNVNMKALVYENRSNERLPGNGHVSVKLAGDGQNTFGVGSKVTLNLGGKKIYQELSPMRGFMSSVDYRMTFGVGTAKVIDTLEVKWPDGRVSVLKDVAVGGLTEVRVAEATLRQAKDKGQGTRTRFRNESVKGVEFIHRESDFVDFDRDRLLYNMVSNEGPCLCKGDVNGDRQDDFYVGGAKGQAGELFVRSGDGFVKSAQQSFEDDRSSEDADCVFFDANGDGRSDLYVVSGSNEHSSSSVALADRLYINKGGKMVRTEQLLPTSNFESTSSVAVADFDQDGDNDLFVGGRMRPGTYGIPANGYVLANDGKGIFTDVSGQVAPGLAHVGMVTDARWADLDSDGAADLVLCGEWMPLKVFMNRGGKLADESGKMGLENTEGWYHSLEVSDVNGDGRTDLIAGNHGLNSRFKASAGAPIRLYLHDFDRNGTVEHVLTRDVGGKQLPYALRPDLVAQIPALRKKYLHFRNYTGQTVEQIFTPEQLEGAMQLTVNELGTTLYINEGEKGFVKRELPVEAQFSPVYSIVTEDFDGDGKQDIFMGGNLYRAKPETGIYDASYGLLLKGDGRGNFEAVSSKKSGLLVMGEVRSALTMKVGNKRMLVVGRNNMGIQFISY